MIKNIKPDEKCKGCKYLVDWTNNKNNKFPEGKDERTD